MMQKTRINNLPKIQLTWQKIPAVLWKVWKTMIRKAQVGTVTVVVMVHDLPAVEPIKALLVPVSRAVILPVSIKKRQNKIFMSCNWQTCFYFQEI